MDAVTGLHRWYVMALRAGELMALYALGYGLFIWAGADTARWRRIKTGCVLVGFGLMILSLITYQAVVRSLDSPFIPPNYADWLKQPHLWRIGIACAVLLSSGLGHSMKRTQASLVITLIALAAYRLVPELHLWLMPFNRYLP
jgi:hypothetical protein